MHGREARRTPGTVSLARAIQATEQAHQKHPAPQSATVLIEIPLHDGQRRCATCRSWLLPRVAHAERRALLIAVSKCYRSI